MVELAAAIEAISVLFAGRNFAPLRSADPRQTLDATLVLGWPIFPVTGPRRKTISALKPRLCQNRTRLLEKSRNSLFCLQLGHHSGTLFSPQLVRGQDWAADIVDQLTSAGGAGQGRAVAALQAKYKDFL